MNRRTAAEEAGLDAAMAMASRMFEKKPNQVELHLSREQIAALIAIGFEKGAIYASTKVMEAIKGLSV